MPAILLPTSHNDMDNTIVGGDKMVLTVDYTMLGELVTPKKNLPWNYETFVGVHGGKTFGQILLDTKTELNLQFDQSRWQGLVTEELDRVVERIEAGDLIECEHASESLRALAAMGRKQYIVSSSHRKRIVASMKAIGLGDIITEADIISAQSDFDPSRPKPDPFCYLQSFARIDRGHRRGWIIEDAKTGMNAIKNLVLAAAELNRATGMDGFEIRSIWYTGMVEPQHLVPWRKVAIACGMNFETNDWLRVPEIYDLVDSGREDEAKSRFGLAL